MRTTQQSSESAAPTAPGARPAHRGGLLALQRAAGNTAVSALVGAPQRTPLQRAVLADSLRAAVAATPAAVTVQRDLAGDLRRMIEPTGPPDYTAVIAAIRAAPAVERRTAVADTGLMQLVGRRLSPEYATTVASALLEDTRQWQNPPGNDFFRHFLLGQGPGLSSPNATMNCWESIIFAAYLAQVVNADWIRRFYTTAMTSQPDPNVAIWTLLGWSTALPVYHPGAAAQPGVGQLVFYQTGGAYPGHVAIYLGNGRVMSLWNQPNGVDRIQDIAITALAGTIQFGNPPW